MSVRFLATMQQQNPHSIVWQVNASTGTFKQLGLHWVCARAWDLVRSETRR